jgi:hypothetical protein
MLSYAEHGRIPVEAQGRGPGGAQKESNLGPFNWNFDSVRRG